jgi:hypothetical protein
LTKLGYLLAIAYGGHFVPMPFGHATRTRKAHCPLGDHGKVFNSFLFAYLPNCTAEKTMKRTFNLSIPEKLGKIALFNKGHIFCQIFKN